LTAKLKVSFDSADRDVREANVEALSTDRRFVNALGANDPTTGN
jgi:hypothetical protein